jgi:hypothetical protein
MTRARRCGFVAAQPGCRRLRIGDGMLDLGMFRESDLAWTSPVLGSKTSPKRPEVP